MRRSRIAKPRGLAGAGGFTLIEALTATAILALVVLLLAQMAGLTSTTFADVVGRTQRQQALRAITHGIRSDVSGALAPVYGAGSAFQFLQNPTTVGGSFQNPSAIFWQAPLAADFRAGDASVVGYFVQWDTSDSTNPRPQLCRVQIDPGMTNYRIGNNPASSWVDSAILAAEAPGSRASNYAGLFAEDVPGLWVTVLDEDGAVLARSDEAFDSQSTGMPAALQVSYAVIEPRAASRITPAIRATLESHVSASESAADFVQRVSGDDGLGALRGGLQSAVTTIYLRNAR